MKGENSVELNHSDRNCRSMSKEEFCRFCHLLYERHLVTGVGGNMSARINDQVLLTPSGCSLRDIRPEEVLSVDIKGPISERVRPTRDAGMHLALLKARPDVNVVFHVHGAHIIAATAMLSPGPDTLPPLTPGFVYYAYPLAMIKFITPGTDTLARAVTKELRGKYRKALFLQNHGLVTLGKDFHEALNVAEEIDEAARIFTITNGNAKAIPLKDLDSIS